MPKMRSSNQCQGQLSCGRSHNKSRLLWLESEAPPREAGKLLGISKVSFLSLSLSLCVYLNKLPETLCVGTEYLRWYHERGDQLRAICCIYFDLSRSHVARLCSHDRPRLSQPPPFSNLLPKHTASSHPVVSYRERKAQVVDCSNTYPTVKNCLISCLRDLISCLYSPIRSFLPSTMQVRFGRGLYL